MRKPLSSSSFSALALPFALLAALLLFGLPAHAGGSPPASALLQRADGLLRTMTVEEKIGQTMLVFFEGPELSADLREMISRFHVGGVILYDSAGNVTDMAQLAALNRDMQRLAASGRHKLGLFISIDQEGGPVARLREGFAAAPPNMAVGATGDAANAALAARVTARQLKALGINMNLAPVVDVNSNPDNPIIGVRSYGTDAATVSRFGTAAVAAYAEEGVIACAKHFPGHGDTGFDSHVRLPTVPHDIERLRSVELPPFAAAIKAGVPAIMTAHVEIPAVEPEPSLPATMSRKVLHGLLREELGFQGLVVSDSLGMGAIDRRYGPGDAALNALNAGADLLCFGADRGHHPSEQRRAILRLKEAVASGELPMQRLDEAVRRILMLKLAYGLDDDATDGIDAAQVNTPEDRDAMDRLADAGIQILADDDAALPLSESMRVLVVAPGARPEAAADIAAMNARTDTLALPSNPTSEDGAALVARAASYDRIVLLTSRTASNPGQLALLDALVSAGLGARTVAVSLGVPDDIASRTDAPCRIAAFSDRRPMTGALARVLYGVRLRAASKP